MKVIKRDGREVDYSITNTQRAILKAAMEIVNKKSEAEVISKKVSSVVDKMVLERYNKPTVEDIQDIIEENLMSMGYFEIARNFILYREHQKSKREGEWLNTELSKSIWEKKYQYDSETLDEFLNRITNGNNKISKMIRGKYFCPAGRILANRGLDRDGTKITYSNCYVNPKPSDNIESIFQSAAELARTFSYGGGAGIDISNLRPLGSKVNNAASTTSGACSFMDLYDVTSRIIGQKGRRAALMISMKITHPDIENFIDIKNNLDSITKANISIRVTEEFLKAVKEEKPFNQAFYINDTGEIIKKEVDASRLFNKIAYSNWRMAEPGFLFWDRIKSWTLLSEDSTFKFGGVNPCGEQCLPVGGSCLLSSLNLSEFIVHPFTEKAYFDYEKFIKYVKYGVDYLNEVLDEGLELHPLKVQRESVRDLRQIGLGIMGLADMFIKLGIKYGSKKSISISKKIGKAMINAALQESATLAKKDGTYPRYHKNYILKSEFLRKNALSETYKLILKHGLRNSQLLTIAPTGTISNMFGVSGGSEPIYALSYKRKTVTLHDKEQEYEIYTPIVSDFLKIHDIEVDELPEYFVTSHDINFRDRVKLQSVWQQYIDAAISSTINLPNESSINDIKELYMLAWKEGLKGVTIYRDGCARRGILSTNETSDFKDMDEDDFIDAGICPECKGNLKKTGGCTECPFCGYSVCST